MRLELRHLRVICAIADTGSLSKAAADLGLAPSALTTQLQRIERSIGGALFDRDRRGARPTALGDLVATRARTLIPAINDLHDEAMRLAVNSTQQHYLRLGSVNSAILGSLVRGIATDDAAVDVSVVPSSSPEELADLLVDGRIDYALIGVCGGAAPPERHNVTWREVATDAVFVLLPTSHEQADREEIDLRELAEASWVASGPYKCCFEECFAAACAQAGFTVRHFYHMHPSAGLELVEAGIAVALCQSTFRPPEGLVSVPLAGVPLRWRHLVGWQITSVDAPAARRFVDQAQEAYREALKRVPNSEAWLARQSGLGVPLA